MTAQAFTSVALINLLMMPVLIMLQVFPNLIGCIGSFDRIQEYCNYAEDASSQTRTDKRDKHDESSISLQSLSPAAPEPGSDESKHAITIDNHSFAWGKEQRPVLTNIDLRIAKGGITILVGSVGSGKTMLLESILGETIMTSGNPVDRPSSVAYCAQQPWLEGGTIRSNVVGVYTHDLKWYRTVTSACGLEKDLQSLDKGDLTVVGSKGVNLSGGQKQRIALARAVYSRQEIVMLDDVFSGMDGHTAESVSRRLLGGSGLLRTRGTTVILATHNHKLMTLADTLVVIEDGRVVETGSPQTLLSSDGYVAKLGLSLRDEEALGVDDDIARTESAALEKAVSTVMASDVDKDSEDPRRKNGDWSVYSYYFSSSGWITVASFLIGMAIWIFCEEFPTVWLEWWSAANEVEPNKDVGKYLGVYALLCLVGVISVGCACWLGFIKIVSRTSYRLHSDLLASTIGAPLCFFTSTDTGTLTNRFSQDMELIDMNLPIIMVNYITTAFTTVGKALILLVVSKYLAVTTPFVIGILYVLQSFYLQTSRQVRLLEIEAKAPLYTHFLESVAGAATIRAFGWQSHYQQRNYRFIDEAQRPAYLQYCIQHWLSFVLDMVVTVLAIILVAIVVTWRDKFSAGNVGVSLVMVTTFNVVLMRMIKMWTMMESSIGAVARVKRFVAETESEEKDRWTAEVGKEWPERGQVEFKKLTAAYKSDAEPVINDVSLSIKAGEHVAICGRSGSGKSSLVLAMLQMVETTGGQILVDGVDLFKVSGKDVRSHLNVVPQDPFLMPGTIRFNIDPFGKASDEDIVRALERVRLWTIVQGQGGLGKEMDTAAWSAGQKQLLCLARAMVRHCKVLILDEATSRYVSLRTHSHGSCHANLNPVSTVRPSPSCRISSTQSSRTALSSQSCTVSSTSLGTRKSHCWRVARCWSLTRHQHC